MHFLNIRTAALAEGGPPASNLQKYMPSMCTARTLADLELQTCGCVHLMLTIKDNLDGQCAIQLVPQHLRMCMRLNGQQLHMTSLQVVLQQPHMCFLAVGVT